MLGERLILSKAVQNRHALYVKFQNPFFIDLPKGKRKLKKKKINEE